jgi:hypothetical protein
MGNNFSIASFEWGVIRGWGANGGWGVFEIIYNFSIFFQNLTKNVKNESNISSRLSFRCYKTICFFVIISAGKTFVNEKSL